MYSSVEFTIFFEPWYWSRDYDFYLKSTSYQDDCTLESKIGSSYFWNIRIFASALGPIIGLTPVH